MTAPALQAERLHLARLLDAVQRCAFHLPTSARKLPWPLAGDALHRRRKDVEPATDDFTAEFNAVPAETGLAS